MGDLRGSSKAEHFVTVVDLDELDPFVAEELLHAVIARRQTPPKQAAQLADYDAVLARNASQMAVLRTAVGVRESW
jgi:hypothetical protein